MSMSMLLPKHFPEVFLRIQFRAVARQTVQLHLLARVGHKFFNRVALVIGRAVYNQDQVSVGRIAKPYQKGAESFLRKIAQLNAVAEQPRAGNGAKSFNPFVTPKGLLLRRVSN